MSCQRKFVSIRLISSLIGSARRRQDDIRIAEDQRKSLLLTVRIPVKLLQMAAESLFPQTLIAEDIICVRSNEAAAAKVTPEQTDELIAAECVVRSTSCSKKDQTGADRLAFHTHLS